MSTALPFYQPSPFPQPFTRPSRKRSHPTDDDLQRDAPLSKRLSRLSINARDRPQSYLPQQQQQQQQQPQQPQPQPSYYNAPQTYPPQPSTPTLRPTTPPSVDTDMDLDSPSPSSPTSSDSDSETPFLLPKHIKRTLNRLPYSLLRQSSSSSPGSPSSSAFPVTGQELVLYRPVDPARDEREEMKRRFLEARERERRRLAGLGAVGAGGEEVGSRVVELDDEGNEITEWDPDAMEIE